jgi:hypothetical protein
MNANESAKRRRVTGLRCPSGHEITVKEMEAANGCPECGAKNLDVVYAGPAPPLVPATEGPEPTQVGHVWNKQRGICSCGEWCRDQAERNYHLVQVYPASELVTYQQRVVSGTEGPLRDTLENLAMEWEQSLVVRHECPPETAQGVEYWHKRLKDYQLKCASELRAALAAHPK